MIYSLHVTFRDVGVGGLGGKSRRLSDYAGNNLSDYVLLNTCNRAELYSTNEADLEGFKKVSGVNAIRHLLRVACGLDSMLLGENEILGQVRRAYHTALSEGHCSGELSSVVESAVRLGRSVRAKTRIGEGRTSVASLAVEYVLEQKDYEAGEVLVVGSGVMGSKVACALKNRGVKQIFLANRRKERAEGLARKVDGVVADYRRLPEFLKEASVVFTVTSAPHTIIRPEMVPAGRKILFVDLGVPCNVSGQVEGIAGVRVVRLG